MSAALFAQDPRSAARDEAHAKLIRSGDSFTVVADDPRPLEQAALVISHEFGWTISYEDPAYASRFDVKESPRRDIASGNESGAPRVLFPSGGAFSSAFIYTASAAPTIGREDILQRVVSDYNASHNPGGFKLMVLANARYAIVGNATRDDHGAMVEVLPILDTVVSIPDENRRMDESLEMILAAVAEKSGTAIHLGKLAAGFLQQNYAEVGGDGLPARELILKTFDAHRAVEWQLQYEPATHSYELNIVLPVGYSKL